MKKILCISGILLILTVLFVPKASTTDFEWTIKKELELKAPALDISQSEDGKWIFILSPGEILIYSNPEDKVKTRIPVDKALDGLLYYESNNTLILTSSRERILKIIQLEPIEKFDISGSPFKGPETAPVTIVVFGDYQCPYCARLDPVMDQIIDKHSKNAKLVFKHFPLSSHKFAKIAAQAALSAGIQGKFWEFHKRLFENYNDLDEAKIQEIAKGLNLDMEKFNQDINNPDINNLIMRDIGNALEAGVNGIPTIFINGKEVKSRSPENIEAMINEEIER
ncbi:MAG: DsbA family protein [bacterium]